MNLAKSALLVACSFAMLGAFGCGAKEQISYERKVHVSQQLIEMQPGELSLDFEAVKESKAVTTTPEKELAIEGEVTLKENETIGPFLAQVVFASSTGPITMQTATGTPDELGDSKYKYRLELKAPKEARTFDLQIKCLQSSVAKCKLTVK